MTADLGNRALYRPIDNVDRGWGVRLLDAGYATVRPHEAYPPQHHPAPYMFTWEKGRCLEDFHILFIGQGRGVLETARRSPSPAASRPVRAGMRASCWMARRST